jgi:RNA polymerase sigma-70 factor, ECF subfamily
MSDTPAEFTELYRAELAYVLRTLRRLGVPAADVEDAAHDVFVAAFRRGDDRDPGRPVRPWLFGIAYRVVGNYRQKAFRQREVPAEGREPRDARPTPAEDAEQSEQRELVLRALDSLDLEHRAVAVLHELDGLAAPAIAETLGIPLNTVYSRARNARRKLLDAVRTLQGGDR